MTSIYLRDMQYAKFTSRGIYDCLFTINVAAAICGGTSAGGDF